MTQVKNGAKREWANRVMRSKFKTKIDDGNAEIETTVERS
jgi:hypothetical protein